VFTSLSGITGLELVVIHPLSRLTLTAFIDGGTLIAIAEDGRKRYCEFAVQLGCFEILYVDAELASKPVQPQPGPQRWLRA
jgi:hypothetical protein